MSIAAPDDHDDEEESAEAAEADAEEPENPADLDGAEEEGQDSLDEDDVAGEAAAPGDEVYLEWADEWGIHDDGTLPLDEAVEENGRIFLTAATDWQLEDVKEEIEDLREENQKLRQRIESLQGWKGNVVGRLNETSENVRLLLTASDLDVNGACPECSSGTLEAVTGFGQTNRIECANEDCDHVAAELE